MFISYSMFIFLIILTIIMIALIIYLTMTAKGPNKQKKTTNTTVSSSITTQEPVQPNEQSSITSRAYRNSDTNYLNEQPENNFYNQRQTNQDTFDTTQTEQSRSSYADRSEQSSLEDELHVLPYPKKDNTEDGTMYSTSIFTRSSQNKDTQETGTENHDSTNNK